MNEAWKWCPLGEVTIPASTWSPRTDPRPLIRYVDVSAVSRDELKIISDMEYTSADAPSRARKVVKAGDTIIATVRPALRRIAQIPAALHGEIVSTAFCVLRPNLAKIDPDFLFFAMQLDSVIDGIASMQTGASYPAVRDTDVFSQAIPLPPLSDQSHIVTVLNLVRSSLLGQKKCEVAVMILKRSAMRTLFTHGLLGEPQKETEIGSIPGSWDVSQLATLCQSTGSVDLPSEADRLIEYVDVSSISRDYLRIDTASRFILKDAPSRARKRMLSGDVLFATVRPTLLRTAIVPEELDNQVCSTAFCVLRRNPKKVADKFIYYLVQREQFVQQLAGIETGASYPAVTDRVVKGQIVPVPPVDEQCEIVAVLDAIDRKIDLHRRKRALLEELLKTLLHKLITKNIHVREGGTVEIVGVQGDSRDFPSDRYGSYYEH